MIGIIGGMGPYAGLDLVRKVFDNTRAEKDQEHLPVILSSIPGRIPDRTEYLDYLRRRIDRPGEDQEPVTNPGLDIADIIRGMCRMGVSLAGIACNTAHAPLIWDEIRKELEGEPVRLMNMIEETALYLKGEGLDKVGLLATRGTYRSQLYRQYLERQGIRTLVPEPDMREGVHQAIYDPVYGIKANKQRITFEAVQNLIFAANDLVGQGAETIILGCTELPLVREQIRRVGVQYVDPSLVLARALIREYRADLLLERDTRD